MASDAPRLVDLQVEGSAQSTVTEEQKMELDRKILSSEAEKHALAREIEGFARQVAQLEDDLRVSQAEKEDLVHELLAARQSLEMQRQQGMVSGSRRVPLSASECPSECAA
jgi:chromosome segregation ATPase